MRGQIQGSTLAPSETKAGSAIENRGGRALLLQTQPLSRVDIDHARARAELPGLAERTAALIRSVPDPDASIPHSEWTITDAAAHLVCALGWFIDFAGGWRSPVQPGEGAAANARAIAELGERDSDRLAQMYLDRVQSYLDVSANLPADQPVYWHYGVVVTLSMVSCLAVGESLVHAYDIARTAKRPWRIDPQAASLFLGAVAPILPLIVHPDKARGLRASYRLRLRGGPTFVMRIDNGKASVEPVSRNPVDVHISLDPVAAFLLIYGRVTQWSLLPQGKVLVWGHKPWLGMKFGSLLAKP